MNMGILLAMDHKTILSYILATIIVVVGGILVARHLKTKKGSEELEKFLNDIESVVRNEILETLAKIDFKDFTKVSESIADAEIDLINNLYDKIWELCVKHLDEAYTDNSLYTIMKATLTKDFVLSFAQYIIESKAVQSLIGEKIESVVELDEADNLEKEYEKINEAIENDTYAKGEYIEEISDEEAVIGNVEPIVPPTEEEVDSDEGVELVGEKVDVEEKNEFLAAVDAINSESDEEDEE